MESTLQSVLVTSVRWSRNILLLLLVLFSFASLAQDDKAEKEKPGLSEKELRRFNELFFMAEKEKNLGNLEQARDIYEQLYEMDDANETVGAGDGDTDDGDIRDGEANEGDTGDGDPMTVTPVSQE